MRLLIRRMLVVSLRRTSNDVADNYLKQFAGNLAVDKFGKRFMDEYPPAPQDTGTRSLEFYDADIQDYPRIPCHLIFDEEGRKLGPIGIPIVNDERYEASWSEDNLSEVNKGWIKKGNSLEDIAAQIDVNPKVLKATVERWNERGSLADREQHAS